jgi:hypothetical protein
VTPTYTRAQARRILVALGVFWGCWALGFIGIVSSVSVLAGPFVIVGLGAGFLVFVTIGDGYEEYSGISGASLMFGLSFAWKRQRVKAAVTFAILRPAWWRTVTATSGWPGRRVAPILGGLVVLDLVIYAAVLTSRS